MSIVKQSLVGASGQGGGYTIDDSLRFRSSASAYLSRTPASATNQKTWTWSGWVKRGDLSSYMQLFDASSAATNQCRISFTTANAIQVDDYNGSFQLRLTTSALYRDPSAWYHIVVAVDTTQSTSSNRASIYINGVKQTSLSNEIYPSQNYDTNFNSTIAHNIGRRVYNNDFFLDGYLTEINWIDGQALTADDFGEYDANGTWKAKDYTGTYGTNGFYLPFRNPTGGSVSADYLVVAGGGGGTYANAGGGGEVIESTSQTLFLNTSYAVTVGAGGAGGNPGADGSNSVFATDTANSGKRPTSAYGAAGTSGNGTLGGTGRNVGSPPFLGGGGGGDGQVGANASGSAAGAGGNGTSSNITGTPVLYGAGGGGGAEGSGTRGLGGNTGGGNGTGVLGSPAGSAGAANTGGGGGGGDGGNTTLGHAGGSGVVIISYSGAQQFNGGTITSSGGNTIHTFTTSDILTPVFNDDSGNDNNWTGNNFNVSDSTAATYDLMKDTPSLVDENAANFAVINPLVGPSADTISEGNLKIATSLSYAAFSHTRATIGVSSGKWYWEVEWDATSATSALACIGITTAVLNPYSQCIGQGAATVSYGYRNDAYKFSGGSISSYGASYTVGDVIGVALDLDAGTIAFYKNGAAQGTAYSSISGTYFPGISDVNNDAGRNSTFIVNFGQRPFAYTPPTGFLKLNTFNLPDSTIEDGSDQFNTVLYTGNATTDTAITGVGFQPDFVWLKDRTNAERNILFDVVRGPSYVLSTNTTSADDNRSDFWKTLDSDGFTLGYNDPTNRNGDAFVSWNWKANGSGVSNTVGTITSTVSANTTAGFSVVSWSGNSTNGATVGHGLGTAPNIILTKCRSDATSWILGVGGMSDFGVNDYFNFQTTGAKSSTTTFYQGYSANTFQVGVSAANEMNKTGRTYISYCFSEVEGYSAFGSYTGNTSTDGPFIYTGFRPAWVMLKRDTAGYNWFVLDATRNSYNALGAYLNPNTANAEASATLFDFTSNGFKIRATSSGINTGTIIYMAFAENPFKNANAR